MQQSKFASIKRSTNNDNHDRESEEYSFKIFDTREEAVTWLLEQYEHWKVMLALIVIIKVGVQIFQTGKCCITSS